MTVYFVTTDKKTQSNFATCCIIMQEADTKLQNMKLQVNLSIK